MKVHEKARFDARLPKEQKELFEKAARIGGYRSLSDFVILSAKQRAEEIIKRHEKILSSKRDREIFFDAILNPGKPNKNLLKAAKKYEDKLS